MLKKIILFSLLALLFSNLQAAPEVESWRTLGGAKVMYVRAEGLPMVDVRVVFDAGSARDGRLAGLASFTNAMLSEGAGEWDADQVARRLEDRGIQLGSGSLRDMAWVSIRSLTEADSVNVALEMLAAILSKPRMQQEDIERIRQQMQIAYRQSLQSPSAVARRMFFKSIFAEHPYAHDPGGSEPSLAAINRDHLLNFHKKHYVSANAVIAIVGDVDRSRAEAIATQLMTGLPAGGHAEILPEPGSVSAANEYEEFPSSQTHILVGQKGMSRHDPDYFPLYVGNHVLGGSGLVSILGEEVRNKRGLSYSVYSYFSPMRVSGPFIMSAQTKNTQAGEALEVMRETLLRFIENGPTEHELDESKKNITGGFPLQVSSNKKIVEYIAMMGFYNYPLDWLDTLVDKVNSVTVQQVRSAFRRRLDPENMLAVMVGGPANAKVDTP